MECCFEPGPALAGSKVAEFAASGLIFKDTVEVRSCYVTHTAWRAGKYPIAKTLCQGQFVIFWLLTTLLYTNRRAAHAQA